MKLSAIPFRLHFKKPFRIAHGTRLFTETTYIKAEQDDITGWGEAATPPYFHENPDSIKAFTNSLQFENIHTEAELFQVLHIVHSAEDNNAAKAAVEMALLDWYGKKNNKSVYRLLNIPFTKTITTAYTIPIGNEKAFIESMNDAADFNLLKIKMGSEWDDAVIDLIPRYVNKPFAVDANQGWDNKIEALDKINRLAAHGALFVEQPLPVAATDEQRWLKTHSPVPVYGDESVQTIADLPLAAELFHGINIKLVKCGGITNGLEMIKAARKLNLKILVGCMSESSCAVMAAAHLASLADYADLDGPFLIANNPFNAMQSENGNFLLREENGLGIHNIMPL